MKKYILFIVTVLVLNSCGTFVNETYIHQNSCLQKQYTPLEIAENNSDFIRQDTNIYFYKINKDVIKNIAKARKKYTLFVSFYGFCDYSTRYFDTVYDYAKKNNLDLFVIDNTDWLYQNRSAFFFKQRNYNRHIFALDIKKYGTQFHCRKKWRSFIFDLCGNKTQSFGYNDIILLDCRGKVVLYGDFMEIKNELDDIFKQMKNN